MTIKEFNLKRILIINPFGIGDILFTTPVVRNIRRNFPEAYIAYLCNIRTADILKANTYIDTVFVFEKDYYRQIWQKSKIRCINEFRLLLKSIKKERFDVVIDLSLGRHYSFFCWLIGIKKRIGFNYKNRGLFLTDKINIQGYENKHVVEYYLGLLRYLMIDCKDDYIDLFIADKDKTWSEKFLSEHGINSYDTLVAIVPGGGASWGKDASIKHWSPVGFAKVADKLFYQHGIKSLILGDSKDRDSCLEVANNMKSKVIQCCGKTDIMQFAALISRCNLVITNDGGPLHIAVASGTKTVSIFGPVDDKVYGPYPRTASHKVIKTDLSCQPCYYRFKFPPCVKERECLKDVDVDKVYEAAKELLVL